MLPLNGEHPVVLLCWVVDGDDVVLVRWRDGVVASEAGRDSHRLGHRGTATVGDGDAAHLEFF